MASCCIKLRENYLMCKLEVGGVGLLFVIKFKSSSGVQLKLPTVT